MANDDRQDIDKRRPIIAQIVARAWNDEAFKKELLSNTAKVLKDYGIAVPPGVEVRIHEDTEYVENSVLPMRPPNLRDKKPVTAEDVVIGVCFYCFSESHHQHGHH